MGDGLDVDPQQFFTAATNMQVQAQSVGVGVYNLTASLAGCGQMAGSNNGAQKWAAAYDKYVASLVKAAGALAKECGTKADILNAAGVAYYNAEAASNTHKHDTIPAKEITDVVDMKRDVPSASEGDGRKSSWWHYVEGKVGDVWPDAADGKLDSAKDAWGVLATVLSNAGDGVIRV